MAAEEEGEEPKQVKWRVIIALRLWLDVSRQINHLPTGPGFGEGQAALLADTLRALLAYDCWVEQEAFLGAASRG